LKKLTRPSRLRRKASPQGHSGFTLEPNVSIDFNHNPNSSTFHMDQTKVIEGTLARILTWYDNEWGFSNRMSDGSGHG
jgi:glyceraldehyde 3-phosphate dehydrogenase